MSTAARDLLAVKMLLVLLSLWLTTHVRLVCLGCFAETVYGTDPNVVVFKRSAHSSPRSLSVLLKVLSINTVQILCKLNHGLLIDLITS